MATIAASATIAGLGWLVSPVISEFVKKSISYLGKDTAKEVEDLQTTILPQLQLTIEAAQRSPDKHKVLLAGWLVRLKNAYFDAERILHELEYKHLKRKAQGEATSSSTSARDWINKKYSSRKRKLLQQLNELKKIAAEAKTFRELLGTQNTGGKDRIIDDNNRLVTSKTPEDTVFGRDGERDEIIKFLLDEQGGSSSRKSYSVVAITGMGGAGKTTLAQYVCDNEKVKKYFPIIIWLSLSQNLDITERTKEMIACVSGTSPDLPNLSELQGKLKKTLPYHILIVLDDLWYDNDNDIEWENLLKPFKGRICKIMINSRSSLFPNALKPDKLIVLSDLARDDFIKLLRYHAFDGLKISNPQLEKDLSDIVEQIAEKMSKLPLAAKVVGNQLCNRPNITFWRATLENVNLSDIMKILLWSFYRLDVQLQRCFLFCSVFPKGTRHDKLHLFVPYWVALDFIQPSDDNRNVEDIGSEYIEIMLKNSIFHLVDKTYIMHDLFYELAEKLSAGDCFKVINGEREICSTVQHVYLRVNYKNLKENLSSICHLSNLRTLILRNLYIDDISEIISDIPKKFRNLRVLDVQSRGYKTLTTDIGDLRNLRLLNFRLTSIKELPDSISQLYHLQFLYLPSDVEALPKKLSNLIKLRRFVMNKNNGDGTHIHSLPQIPYLGKLTSLQDLDEFHVGKEEGYKLKQLGPLKEISGFLRITNLENVKDKYEAVEARLIDKRKLKILQLEWSQSAEINGSEIDENNSEIEVIEALRPPANLESLTIVGYRGAIYPTWLKDGSDSDNIKVVWFVNCNALTNLPPNFHQFRHCSQLVLQNLGALIELSTFPENLVALEICKCRCLIFVCENELQVNENHSTMENRFSTRRVGGHKEALAHELKSFKMTGSVENCADQLKVLENAARSNAPQLSEDENVNIAWLHCHQQRMKFMFSARANKLKLPSKLRILDLGYCCVSDGALSDCLTEMVTLEKLYLSGIMTITTLPPAEVLKSLQSLKILEIIDCWYLTSFGGLHALPHLQNFLIQCCWCFEMESGDTSRKLPLTLQCFIIRNCAVPQAIFSGHLKNLQKIDIINCLVSSSLSFDQLTLLKSLTLINCPDLRIIQGLESRPFISTLVLFDLPNLVVESVLKSWQGCRDKLFISNSMMLNKLLSSPDFVPPPHLFIEYCDEEEISFVESDHLQSIKSLVFSNCKIESLPNTLSDFSTIHVIHFSNCHFISELPELPHSVQHILIRGCPVLRERCQPNGPDWHKIQHIENIHIE